MSEPKRYELHFWPADADKPDITRYDTREQAVDALRHAVRQPSFTGGAQGGEAPKRRRFRVEVVDEDGTMIEAAQGGEIA